MSIFEKRKALKSSTAASAKQEKPGTTTYILNIFGTSDLCVNPWVHTDMRPNIPMPREETVTFNDLPLRNCAVPAGWFFSDYSDDEDEEMIYRFPTELSDYLSVCFPEGAVIGTKYISFKFNRDTGTITATAWGLNYPDIHRGIWQVTITMEVVQTFRKYVGLLPNGIPAMSTKLCNKDFVNSICRSNPLRTRVGYGLPANEAEDVYWLLMEHISLFIRNATCGRFKHDLQAKADRNFESVRANMEEIEKLVQESESLSTHIAAKEFYGFSSTKSDWTAAQAIYDRFVTTVANLDPTVSFYIWLRNSENSCGLKINLSKYEEFFKLVSCCSKKLNSLFCLLRG